MSRRIYQSNEALINGRRKMRKERYYRLRGLIFHLLGDKCVKCGFLDARALQIDHVNGDGRLFTVSEKTNMLLMFNTIQVDLRAGTQKYQLLCANCN